MNETQMVERNTNDTLRQMKKLRVTLEKLTGRKIKWAFDLPCANTDAGFFELGKIPVNPGRGKAQYPPNREFSSLTLEAIANIETVRRFVEKETVTAGALETAHRWLAARAVDCERGERWLRKNYLKWRDQITAEIKTREEAISAHNVVTKKPGPGRNPAYDSKDLKRVADMRQQGWGVNDIARETNLKRPKIRKMLDAQRQQNKRKLKS